MRGGCSLFSTNSCPLAARAGGALGGADGDPLWQLDARRLLAAQFFKDEEDILRGNKPDTLSKDLAPALFHFQTLSEEEQKAARAAALDAKVAALRAVVATAEESEELSMLGTAAGLAAAPAAPLAAAAAAAAHPAVDLFLSAAVERAICGFKDRRWLNGLRSTASATEVHSDGLSAWQYGRAFLSCLRELDVNVLAQPVRLLCQRLEERLSCQLEAVVSGAALPLSPLLVQHPTASLTLDNLRTDFCYDGCCAELLHVRGKAGNDHCLTQYKAGCPQASCQTHCEDASCTVHTKAITAGAAAEPRSSKRTFTKFDFLNPLFAAEGSRWAVEKRDFHRCARIPLCCAVLI